MTPQTSAKTPVREIKFRGKRTDNGEWVYGSYHCCIGEAGIRKFEYGKNEATIEKHNLNRHWILVQRTPDSMGWTIHDTYSAYTVHPESVGEWTGLRDKKGTEIYEGDVVEEEVETEYGINKIKHEVTFDAGAFYPVCMQPSTTFEILGNIYTNPELLPSK